MTTSPHYTASVEISKTTPGEEGTGGAYGKPGTPRVVEDLTRVVVRASSLDELKTRLISHVELVAE